MLTLGWADGWNGGGMDQKTNYRFSGGRIAPEGPAFNDLNVLNDPNAPSDPSQEFFSGLIVVVEIETYKPIDVPIIHNPLIFKMRPQNAPSFLKNTNI